MKFVAYTRNGTPGVGELDAAAGTVAPFDLTAEQSASGVLALMNGLPARTGETVQLSQVSLRAPVPRPRRNLFCVGKNYFDHAHEFERSGFDASSAGAIPEAPIVFSKVPECVIAAGEPILLDSRVSAALDYEAELAVIVGKGGRGISRERAMDHVWGYTIVNDVTARDLQRTHRQWLIGKSQDSYCPMGPVAVTEDEIDLGSTPVRCWVNGELRQDATTDLLIFDVPTLIETLSRGITLQPGDVIATGTPAGVGIGFDPPRYLRAGDSVRIEIGGIGVLENPVVDHAEREEGVVA